MHAMNVVFKVIPYFCKCMSGMESPHICQILQTISPDFHAVIDHSVNSIVTTSGQVVV